jgi:RNA polymerase sigma-70 factor (ECF subfamily)
MRYPKSGENWLGCFKQGWQDKAMVRRTLAGNRSAFDRLYDRHAPRVFNFLRRLTSSATEAEDLTQETFLAAYQALGGWRGDGAFSTWLCGIAYRRYVALRRHTPLTDSLDGDNISSSTAAAADPFLYCAGQEAEAALETAITALPDAAREVYLLIRVERMSYAETAELLGIPLGTVQSRLWRATQHLRGVLSPFLSDTSPHDASACAKPLLPESSPKGVSHADQTL